MNARIPFTGDEDMYKVCSLCDVNGGLSDSLSRLEQDKVSLLGGLYKKKIISFTICPAHLAYEQSKLIAYEQSHLHDQKTL